MDNERRLSLIDRSLEAAIVGLGPEERKVLEILVARLANGQVTYGLFDVDNDPRDFARETFEEICDASIYSAVQLLKLTK
jgi:hypothetical protein